LSVVASSEASVPTGQLSNVESAPPTLLPPSLQKDWAIPEDGTLGVGAFAKIYKVTEKASGNSFAMKVMERSFFASRGMEYLIMNEINSMKRCVEQGSLRRVVRLFDAREEEGNVYLRMELCQTNLLVHVNSFPGHRAQEGNVNIWAVQLCLGLEDIHQVGIIHRDIKPENLLLAPDGTLKIADFGWSADVTENNCSLAGTFQFMAPEILEEETAHTTAVDVWSAGATLIQVLMGRAFLRVALGLGPTGLSAHDPQGATKVRCTRLLCEIAEVCPLKEEHRPEFLSQCCWEFLRQMLIPEVERRTTIMQALDHPWIRDLRPIFEAPELSDQCQKSRDQSPDLREQSLRIRLSRVASRNVIDQKGAQTPTMGTRSVQLKVDGLENTDASAALSRARMAGGSRRPESPLPQPQAIPGSPRSTINRRQEGRAHAQPHAPHAPPKGQRCESPSAAERHRARTVSPEPHAMVGSSAFPWPGSRDATGSRHLPRSTSINRGMRASELGSAFADDRRNVVRASSTPPEGMQKCSIHGADSARVPDFIDGGSRRDFSCTAPSDRSSRRVAGCPSPAAPRVLRAAPTGLGLTPRGFAEMRPFLTSPPVSPGSHTTQVAKLPSSGTCRVPYHPRVMASRR
jgi:serine/threonine protein kinase